MNLKASAMAALFCAAVAAHAADSNEILAKAKEAAGGNA